MSVASVVDAEIVVVVLEEKSKKWKKEVVGRSERFEEEKQRGSLDSAEAGKNPNFCSFLFCLLFFF